ncbi:ATP-binding protein [Streptomyces sp. TLI_171]|uniref:sensor histidine kinase n=1 Tax=Streptomyces sp. TLI_171 TaxID=1938859 RepID=UPI0015D5332C|nr:ATP-binding protein [Streptomyces sp. TLI_171]
MLTAAFVANRLDSAREAGRGAEAAATVRAVGRLVGALSEERSAAVQHLLTPGDDSSELAARAEDVRAAAAGLRDAADPRLRAAVTALDRLIGTRALLWPGKATPAEVDAAWDGAVDGLVDALGLTTGPAPDPSAAARHQGLDALIRANEQADRAGLEALVLLIAPDLEQGERIRVRTALATAQSLQTQQAARFRQLASSSDRLLFDLVVHGDAADQVAALVSAAGTGDAAQAGSDASRRALSRNLTAVRTQSLLRRLVQDRIARDTLDASQAVSAAARSDAVLLTGLSLLLTAAVVVLSVLLGRSIAGPLRRLTEAASEVAALANSELERVADEVDGGGAEPEPPRLRRLDIRSADEIGALARAVDQVQATAVALVQRQLQGRRNIAGMFRSVGLRTQNLVGRQFEVIDRLESEEQDPVVLERLYRLDHLTARLRRHADALMVLSDQDEPAVDAGPQSLADLLRTALGGVEDYRRVDLTAVPRAEVPPALADDLLLMVTELLDNAIAFSPPHTRVRLAAESWGAGGVLISIVDHGLGMADAARDRENERLVHRERLDLVPTNVLGLFVVGRLSRRHGLNTVLRPTPGGGTTAEVLLPMLPSAAGHHAPAGPSPSRPQAVPGVPARPMESAGIAGTAPVLPRPALPENGLTPGFGWFAQGPPRAAGAKSARSGPALRPPDPDGWDANPAGPAGPAAGQPGDPGAPGLARRVPGASLRAEARSTGAQHPWSGSSWKATDPGAVQADLEAFETGVARAAAAPDAPGQGNRTALAVREHYEEGHRP